MKSCCRTGPSPFSGCLEASRDQTMPKPAQKCNQKSGVLISHAHPGARSEFTRSIVRALPQVVVIDLMECLAPARRWDPNGYTAQ